MSVTKWVFIDETNGAKCGDGSSLDPASLRRIAIACDAQLNSEFADEYGGQYQVRDAADATDIQPGEQVYAFVPTVPNAPGASAYHDTDGKGVPVAYCAVTTCGSLFGANGVSVDATHECLEAGADPSCNLMADNLNGLLVAYEVGDPVEIQTYASHVDSEVQISNFVLKSWFDPKASAPYDFMSAARIAGAVAPPGPLQIAPGNGGNYIITETSSENSTDTFGITSGSPRKERKDTGGRFVRRLMQRQVSRRGKLKIAAGQPAPIVGEAVLTPKDITALASPVPPKVLTAAHMPPGTVERVGAHKTAPAMRPPPRPLPVSLQRQADMAESGPPVGGPQELNGAGVAAAQRFVSRAETRASRPSGQHDPQQAVLEGRRAIRAKLGK